MTFFAIIQGNNNRDIFSLCIRFVQLHDPTLYLMIISLLNIGDFRKEYCHMHRLIISKHTPVMVMASEHFSKERVRERLKRGREQERGGLREGESEKEGEGERERARKRGMERGRERERGGWIEGESEKEIRG